MKIDFYKHSLDKKDIDNVVEVLNSMWLTTGKVVSTFERDFAAYTNNKYAVGVTSCTAALHLSLLANGIGQGDEVITTPLSFVATANAIIYTGAIPIFADVDRETGLIDIEEIKKKITNRTKAIIPVHLYGQLCDIKKMREEFPHLTIIEDAAHSLEGKRDGYMSGNLGDTACFSFYACKNLTCGEGGAITTNDEEIYNRLLKLRNHGLSKTAIDRYTSKYQHYDVECLGWKYNMSNIQAALLVDQLKRIEWLWRMREALYLAYNKKLEAVEKPKILPNCTSAYHVYTIWVENRDEILSYLQDNGVGVAVNFRPIHKFQLYDKLGYSSLSYSNAEYIGNRTLTLPFYPNLDFDQIDYVSNLILKKIHE